MRLTCCGLILGLSGLASAQFPDVQIKLDLRPTYLSSRGGRTTFRWYDPMGRHSTVGVILTLEPGYRFYVAQRLQKIDGDPDRDQLDEMYLEDPGNWRIGRQYLPFGSKTILRECVMAAEAETQLVLAALPLDIAACDGGKGRQRGVVGRIGGRFGVSFAIGDHFGISGSAFNQIRNAFDSPGLGRGHRLALGADYVYGFGPFTVNAEYVALRRGETDDDPDHDISDLRVTYRSPWPRFRLSAAWSREWKAKEDFYRIEGEVPIGNKLSVLPFLRFSGGQWQDFGVTARVRF